MSLVCDECRRYITTCDFCHRPFVHGAKILCVGESAYSDSVHHFCSISCLQDWLYLWFLRDSCVNMSVAVDEEE